MPDVIGLVLPFFGLILLGVVAAHAAKLSIEALGWMNIFIIYFALPSLLFQLLSKTPVAQLTEWTYIFGSVFSTFAVFAIMFVGSVFLSRGNIGESTVKGLAAAYGNIGYMGPAIAIFAFGEKAAVPVALIFCFENLMHFSIAPLMMALSGKSTKPPLALAWHIISKILFHPFIIATVLGVGAAILEVRPAVSLDRLLQTLSQAAAPCALFAMGVTLALRPLKRFPTSILPIAMLKLVIHPALCFVVLSWIGDFSPVWVYTAVLLAALPTATNVYVIAQQYGIWVERASASILITTVLSVITVTTILYAITIGYLPADLFANR